MRRWKFRDWDYFTNESANLGGLAHKVEEGIKIAAGISAEDTIYFVGHELAHIKQPYSMEHEESEVDADRKARELAQVYTNIKSGWYVRTRGIGPQGGEKK